MSSFNLVVQIFYFLVYLLLQVVLMQDVVLFDLAFCYIYLGYLLLQPFESSPIRLMLLGLAIGLAVDIFSNTFGIHAAASVFIMYARAFVVRVLAPRGGYEPGMNPKLRVMGVQWFSGYSLLLIFLHHFFLFFIEAGFVTPGYTLLKVVASTAFTFVVILIVQYLFYSDRRTI
jgi:hypothetical protein